VSVAALHAEELRQPRGYGLPTLESLYREAKVDLANPTMDLVLKWTFRHARATGEIDRLRTKLRRLEAEHWQVTARVASGLPAMTEADNDTFRGITAIIQTSDLEVEQLVAHAQACVSVARLIETASRGRQQAPQQRPPAAKPASPPPHSGERARGRPSP
jgi:hypothetical protein